MDIYGTGTQVILREDSLTVRGAALRSNAVKKAVELGDKEQLEREDQDFRTLALRNCPEKISLLSDGEILEITVDDGLMSDAFETRADGKSGLIRVTSSGTVALEISEIV